VRSPEVGRQKTTLIYPKHAESRLSITWNAIDRTGTRVSVMERVGEEISQRWQLRLLQGYQSQVQTDDGGKASAMSRENVLAIVLESE